MTDHSEERRAILRIHAVWQRLAAQRLPSRADLDPEAFGDDWPCCTVVPIAGGGISETAFDLNVPEQRLASTLLSLSEHRISRVLATRQALGYGGTASHDGIDILYRIVLLPLSEDGTTIDALLVGVTHREVPPASELRVSDIAWCKSPLNLRQAERVEPPNEVRLHTRA